MATLIPLEYPLPHALDPQSDGNEGILSDTGVSGKRVQPSGWKYRPVTTAESLLPPRGGREGQHGFLRRKSKCRHINAHRKIRCWYATDVAKFDTLAKSGHVEKKPLNGGESNCAAYLCSRCGRDQFRIQVLDLRTSGVRILPFPGATTSARIRTISGCPTNRIQAHIEAYTPNLAPRG